MPPPSASIFALIHEIHTTVTKAIDTSLTWEQLNAPPVNYTLIRPIVDRFTPGEDEKGGSSRKGEERGSLNVPVASDRGEAGVSGSSTPRGGTVKGISIGELMYALMANRIQFITLASGDLSYAPLQTSRAAFCEILAMKMIRTYPHPENEADLVGELVKGRCAFAGAPEAVWAGMGDDRKEVEEMTGSALELAIVSTAKHFLSLPLIQHLVNEIYLGHLIYSPVSSRSLISDPYISSRTRQRRRGSHSSFDVPRVTVSSPKNRGRNRSKAKGKAKSRSRSASGEEDLDEVYVYNPFESGWLDHQRLRVPKWRKWLEFASFAILMALFIATLSLKELDTMHPVEGIFVIVSFGFMLEEFAASKEHGWTVYAANAWNAFDLAYISIFLLYLVLRVFALASHSLNTSQLAFDILSCAACIIFPRLVFYLIKDNVVILALKAMIARFVGFMGLTIVAFSGICFCLWTLGRGTWTVKQIVWLMLQIWFGSSYLGFSSSESFHPIFGPIVLIGYAALSNVLLITILISILSNQFAEINANAQEEHLFQKVVKTVEGVKSDAVFSYLPPINILAVIVLAPLSYVCSPRTLHRINVFSIRMTSFPILIAISAWERYEYHSKQRAIQLQTSSVDRVVNTGLFHSFLGGGSEVLIASVFEAGPPVAAGVSTPPKASFSSADPDDAPRRSKTRPSGLDSPLAKIFGRNVGVTDQDVTLRNARSGGREERYEVVEKDLRDIRESQLKMEELLSKFLAGGST